MILATDVSNHFEQISKLHFLLFEFRLLILFFVILVTFKSRCSSKKFPENTMEDKQLILNMTMYAADHANLANMDDMHEGPLLHLLQRRFAADQIYTYTGDILISMTRRARR